jgi:hypothetical protein
MPNFDAGHYFLTVLLPIDNRALVRDDKTFTSPVRIVRRALSVLPKARQSPSTEKTGAKHNLNSPFARSLRTHVVRFVVIDDVIFNGRDPTDALRVALNEKKLDPTIAKAYDQLRCPYLLFVVDFDGDSGDPSELESYLKELWELMPAELTSVFERCYKFDGVKTGQQFADFVKLGQIETTMPFNDYWVPDPTLSSLPSPRMERTLTALSKATLGAVLLGVSALGLWMLFLAINRVTDSDLIRSLVDHIATATGWIWLIVALGIIVILIAGAVLYRQVVTSGTKPFPAGNRSDLKSILKALYLQQRFQDFAIAAQGQPPSVLHQMFRTFLDEHKPSNISTPTQPAGVVKS